MVLGLRERAAEEAPVCLRWAQSIASSLATRHLGRACILNAAWRLPAASFVTGEKAEES